MDSFLRDGYVLLKNKMAVLDKLEEISEKFVELPEEKGKYMKYFEGKDRKLSRIEYMFDFDEDLKEIEETILRPIVEKYFGEKANLFKEKINFKFPGGGAFDPHQDFPAWNDLPPTEYITIGIPLDPMTKENGCLNFAPGIGLDKHIYHQGEKNEIPEEILKSWKWTPVLCGPGDIIVFNSFVPHYSDANKTLKPRRIYYFTYNKASEGDLRNDYFNNKRKLFPQDCEKVSGRDYSKIGAKYNLANPFNKNIVD
jgi:2-aminoethylphosphonate dioxygenase